MCSEFSCPATIYIYINLLLAYSVPFGFEFCFVGQIASWCGLAAATWIRIDDTDSRGKSLPRKQLRYLTQPSTKSTWISPTKSSCAECQNNGRFIMLAKRHLYLKHSTMQMQLHHGLISIWTKPHDLQTPEIPTHPTECFDMVEQLFIWLDTRKIIKFVLVGQQ